MHNRQGILKAATRTTIQMLITLDHRPKRARPNQFSLAEMRTWKETMNFGDLSEPKNNDSDEDAEGEDSPDLDDSDDEFAAHRAY